MRSRLLVVAMGALVALGVGGTPAAAQTSAAAEPATSGVAAECSDRIQRFGYWGTIKCGTEMWADWNSDGIVDEIFAIEPKRTIWHVWPGSGGWKKMPHGLADDTWDWGWNGANRAVVVWVNGKGPWCSIDPADTRSWGAWFYCG